MSNLERLDAAIVAFMKKDIQKSSRYLRVRIEECVNCIKTVEDRTFLIEIIYKSLMNIDYVCDPVMDISYEEHVVAVKDAMFYVHYYMMIFEKNVVVNTDMLEITLTFALSDFLKQSFERCLRKVNMVIET